MNFAEAIIAWLAEKQGKDAALYCELSVSADMDYGYSTLTPGSGLTCDLRFKYDGEQTGYYMAEKEVAEFLEGVWAVSNTGDRPE